MKKVIVAIAICMALTKVAMAQMMVIQHSGANNPTNEGWSLQGLAGSPTNDGGTAAWFINDNSATLRSRYIVDPLVLNSFQTNLLKTVGFHMSWTMNMINAPDPFYYASRAIEVNIGFQQLAGNPRYNMQFGKTNNHAMLFIDDDAGAKTLTITNKGTGFHTWDLFGAPNGNANLYVDGTFVTTWNGVPDSGTFIYFGSVSDGNQGSSSWSQFYLEVPEPSLLGLLTMAGGCLVFIRTRMFGRR